MKRWFWLLAAVLAVLIGAVVANAMSVSTYDDKTAEADFYQLLPDGSEQGGYVRATESCTDGACQLPTVEFFFWTGHFKDGEYQQDFCAGGYGIVEPSGFVFDDSKPKHLKAVINTSLAAYYCGFLDGGGKNVVESGAEGLGEEPPQLPFPTADIYLNLTQAGYPEIGSQSTKVRKACSYKDFYSGDWTNVQADVAGVVTVSGMSFSPADGNFYLGSGRWKHITASCK